MGLTGFRNLALLGWVTARFLQKPGGHPGIGEGSSLFAGCMTPSALCERKEP